MHELFRQRANAKILAFVESRKRNENLSLWPMDVYVRRSARMCGKCFDVANIVVASRYQRHGYATAFFVEAEKIAREHKLGLYVECVGNKHLRRLLERLGYGLVHACEYSPSYIKPYPSIKNDITPNG